ncbi:MAG: hypothetical protein NC408_04540 [Candidatus Gastranaerophilales bacterium]|nr:hypothetical protein [Candidatus Gastranaerophilales bacterium]MCM1072260.1 hypothetical protein [Bacteroides sp.]
MKVNKIELPNGEKLEVGGGTSLPLFTPVLQDHILSFEESKGYALQASYVYKQSTPERYGYPDFYNRCLEEYKNSSTEILKFATISQPVFTSNTTDGITISDSRGNTTVLQAIMNGTNNSNQIGLWSTYWVNIDYNKPTSLQSYQIQADSNSKPEYPSAWTLQGSNDGVNFNVLDAQSEVTFTLGELKTFDITTQNEIYKQYRIVFTAGVESSSQGELKKITFNAVNALPIKKNTNGHLFYDISDKADIDDIFQNYGIAWFYGIDEENERVFLPRGNVSYSVNQDSVPVGGNGKTLGFSDGNGNYGMSLTANTENHCILHTQDFNQSLPSKNTTGYASGTPAGSARIGITTKLELSGLIADVSSLSTFDNIKYLYFVVGNTEEEKALTEVTEVTTSENDTIPLFTGQYFDFKPNNVSWLKAGEQANSGGVYASCYNELVNELTNPKYGLKVIEETEMIAGVDYSEYWIINQDGMYFVTPTKLSYGMLNSTITTVPVIGNGITLGLTNGSQTCGLRALNNYFTPMKGIYGASVGTSTSGNSDTTNGVSYGVTTDTLKSGLIADLSSAKDTTAQLYFKVANAVQNIELLDAGEVLEALADKQDKCIHITETYANGTSGYRIWSDGYCEQWGIVDFSTTYPVVLLKPYADSNYIALAQNIATTTNTTISSCKLNNKTRNGFTFIKNVSSDFAFSWKTSGYLAEGEY